MIEMEITEIEITGTVMNLPFVLAAGAIGAIVFGKLVPHKEWGVARLVLYSALFGAAAYVIAETALPLPQWPVYKTALAYLAAAIALASALAFTENKKYIYRAAKWLKISNKYGDENLFSRFLASTGTGYVYLRDIKNGLTYHGHVKSFSEDDGLSEITMAGVSVYSYPDSALLYETDEVYLSLDKKGIIIEKALKRPTDGCEEPLTPAEKHNEKGMGLSGSGKYEEAILEYEKALELDPLLTAARKNKQYLLRLIKDKEKAKECLAKADALIGKGDFEPSITFCAKAIQLSPKDAKAYNKRGIALTGCSMPGTAIQDHDMAISLDPNFAGAYYERGNALAAMGNLKRALLDYDKAIGLDAKLDKAYNARGKAFLALDRYTEALSDFETAVGLDPYNKTALKNRDSVLKVLNQDKPT